MWVVFGLWYLQLVELEQVAVTAERGQQAALFRPTLRASSGGDEGLRGNALALQRETEEGREEDDRGEIKKENTMSSSYSRQTDTQTHR